MGLVGNSIRSVTDGETATTMRKVAFGGGKLLLSGTASLVRLAPNAITKKPREQLGRMGVIELPVPSAEVIFRSRLETFQESMLLRVPEYTAEIEARKEMGEEQYVGLKKMGLVSDIAFHDAVKWIEIARAEQDPGPTAGGDEEGHINNVAAWFASKDLDHDATERLVLDLYDHYGIAEHIRAQPTMPSGSLIGGQPQ